MYQLLNFKSHANLDPNYDAYHISEGIFELNPRFPNVQPLQFPFLVDVYVNRIKTAQLAFNSYDAALHYVQQFKFTTLHPPDNLPH